MYTNKADKLQQQQIVVVIFLIFYWSSTESIRNSRGTDFCNGDQATGSKDYTDNVRAVRAF